MGRTLSAINLPSSRRSISTFPRYRSAFTWGTAVCSGTMRTRICGSEISGDKTITALKASPNMGGFGSISGTAGNVFIGLGVGKPEFFDCEPYEFEMGAELLAGVQHGRAIKKAAQTPRIHRGW